MMFPIAILISITTTYAQQVSIEDSLDPSDGLTYIHAAEDVLQNTTELESSRQFAKELYVLAAIIDPMYRESAILGIISIEKDPQRISRLHNLRNQNPVLVSAVVHNKQFSSNAKYDTSRICSALVSLRKSRFLTEEDVDSLRPWSILFPDRFHQILQRSRTERILLIDDDVTITLKIELAALGGANVWSADSATTGSRPVVLNMSDDLATLVGVDPTRYIRKNGKWVQK